MVTVTVLALHNINQPGTTNTTRAEDYMAVSLTHSINQSVIYSVQP